MLNRILKPIEIIYAKLRKSNNKLTLLYARFFFSKRINTYAPTFCTNVRFNENISSIQFYLLLFRG